MNIMYDISDFVVTAPGANSSYYCFNSDIFRSCTQFLRNKLNGKAQVCYSLKANPWFIHTASQCCDYIEVCSPGELQICIDAGIPMEQLSVGGITKTTAECERISSLSPHRISVESVAQLKCFEDVACKHKHSLSVLLRLTSGNQFGMPIGQIIKLFNDKSQYSHLELKGIHYYPGTQKKSLKDAKNIIETLICASECLPVKEIQFGAGIGVPLFDGQSDSDYEEYLNYIVNGVSTLADRCSIVLECGRYLSYPAGGYITTVLEVKEQCGRCFLIVDGGIHHLSYYGQIAGKPVPKIKPLVEKKADKKMCYTICGSLCTVSDILAKDVMLPEMNVGDKLIFFNTGAYSVMEARSLFLCHNLPAIVLKNSTDTVIARETMPTSVLNTFSTRRI